MPNMSEAARLTYHVTGNRMHIHISEWRERRGKPSSAFLYSGPRLVEVESPWVVITHIPVTLIVAYSRELHRVYYDPEKQTYFAVADWMANPYDDCILLGKVGPQ